ncbi:MAG TPA: hypothetical protein VHQ47_02135 [Phycisphaerae bacterium]|jgi:hypothetical protein|nr:hypothetical protein [Phycisphaerae bacterium]
MIFSRPALFVSLMVAASLAACSTAPRSEDVAAPDISVNPAHKTMVAGETILVSARTVNLVGAPALRWTVTPNAGRITPRTNNGEIAMFTADQPGTYLITASADAGNGRWVQSSANVTVNGLGIPTNTSANGNYNRNYNANNPNNPNNPNNTYNNPNNTNANNR